MWKEACACKYQVFKRGRSLGDQSMYVNDEYVKGVKCEICHTVYFVKALSLQWNICRKEKCHNMYSVGKDTPYDHWSLWVSTHCDHTPDWEESNVKMWKENFFCLDSFSYCNCRIKFRIADVFCLLNKQLLREECTSKIWKQFWSQWMPFLSVHHWLFLWYQHSSVKPIFRALSGNRSWLALCSLTSLEAEHKIGSINIHYSTKDLKLCTLTFEQGKCCQLDISASAIARTSLRLLLLLLQTPLGKRVNPVDKGARRGHGQVCPGQLSLLTSPLSSCWNWDNLS